MKTQFPKANLPGSWFSGGANLGESETLVKFLNELRSEKRVAVYPVSKYLPGAFKSVEDAVGQASQEVPVTVPRTPVIIFVTPGEWFQVDLDLPTSHSWIFDGASNENPFFGASGLVGRVRTPGFKQNNANPEKNRVVFKNLTLGNGGFTPSPSGLVLQFDVGWNATLRDSLLAGGIIELYSDPLVLSGSPASDLNVWFKNIVNNGAFALKYMEPARSYPNTQTEVHVHDCSLLAGDGIFGDFPGSWCFDGAIDFRVENTTFLCFAENGPGAFKGIGAASCSGAMRFLNTNFFVLTLFSQMNFFGVKMSSVVCEWDNGTNIEEVNYGVPAPSPINLAGVTHRKAPIIVSRTVPLSPPRGTVRRDENATEKYLFWNGAAWV